MADPLRASIGLSTSLKEMLGDLRGASRDIAREMKAAQADAKRAKQDLRDIKEADKQDRKRGGGGYQEAVAQAEKNVQEAEQRTEKYRAKRESLKKEEAAQRNEKKRQEEFQRQIHRVSSGQTSGAGAGDKTLGVGPAVSAINSMLPSSLMGSAMAAVPFIGASLAAASLVEGVMGRLKQGPEDIRRAAQIRGKTEDALFQEAIAIRYGGGKISAADNLSLMRDINQQREKFQATQESGSVFGFVTKFKDLRGFADFLGVSKRGVAAEMQAELLGNIQKASTFGGRGFRSIDDIMEDPDEMRQLRTRVLRQVTGESTFGWLKFEVEDMIAGGAAMDARLQQEALARQTELLDTVDNEINKRRAMAELDPIRRSNRVLLTNQLEAVNRDRFSRINAMVRI